MKLFKKLIYCTVPALLLASCSSDDIIGDEPTAPVEGDGYIAVRINMPSQRGGTRAENDNFDDGLINEYSVSDGAILFFAGSSEATAQFQSAYALNLDKVINDDDDDNITTSFLESVKIAKANLGTGNLYGLAVLNYKNVMTVDNANPKNLLVNGAAFSGTFNELLEKTSQNKFYNTDEEGESYFFMTNSPFSNKPGGQANPDGYNLTYLTVMTNSVYNTQAEAEASPAGSIYVERAVAKATLSTAGVTEAKVNNGKTSLSVASIEWSLSNTEASSYIVRNLGAASYLGYKSDILTPAYYRFIGEKIMGVTSIQPQESLYRTYWCIDPAYSIDKDYDNTTNFVSTERPLYCHENTFDVAHQNFKNTTRAVLKVKYSGGDFYTINGREDILYTDITAARSFSTAYIVNDMTVKNALKDALKANQTIEVANYVNILWERDAKGYQVVKDITFKMDNNVFDKVPAFKPNEKEALISNVNNYYKIAHYQDGVNYYDLRFQHFAGDGESDLAPWSTERKTTLNTEEAYGTAANRDNNYLGRFGMVRNNWYDVKINRILHLGTPEVPDANVLRPDDNVDTEEWISFKVNVLSWAKRLQSVDL